MDKIRLDKALLNQIPSRAKAQDMIKEGKISVNGKVITKASFLVGDEDDIVVTHTEDEFVSRGAFKLKGCLDTYNVNIQNQVVLDIGASTGGFTDVMLQAGAKQVYAVDVGTNQLAWKLRKDERVISMEQYNFRYAELGDFELGQPSFASIDVSFISLSLILPALHRILVDGGQVVALVKPQFEAGREQIGKNGIVKDKSVHLKVLEDVTTMAVENGYSVKALSFSPVQGGHGNIEFLAHLEKSIQPSTIAKEELTKVVYQAHEEFKKDE